MRFLTSSFFEGDGMKTPNNWVGGDQFFKKLSGPKGRGERKCKICRGYGIFSFSFAHY